jgi:hypothetical protein
MTANSEYDVFICHASEDKDEVARPLAEALKGRGLRVWYDEFTMRLGDSLRRKIDHGLANSRYGVVILSIELFRKEWPQKELDGLVARDDGKQKVILPVWHKVDREEVLRYSPVLADRIAVSTDDGLDKVVDKILEAIDESKSPKEGDQLSVDTGPSSPSSKRETLATIKRYLAEPRYRIPLHDLIHEETERVYQILVSDRFPAKVESLTKETFQQRILQYEELVKQLIVVLAELAYHDSGDNANLLTRSIERLIQVPRHDGKVALLGLQFYPALLLMYATGVSALAARRFRNLAAILLEPKYREQSQSQPAVRKVNVWDPFEYDSYKWVPRPGDAVESTPVSNHVSDLLRPLLRDYLPDNEAYEESFDIFEYLLALTYADLVKGSWVPIGRFAYRYRFVDNNRNPVVQFFGAGLSRGTEWELLKAGFFNGSVDSLKQSMQLVEERLGTLRSTYS